VDARGIFTSVNAGRPGSVGDSYKHSEMYKRIKQWLALTQRTTEGATIKLFFIADAAFPLEAICMKCYYNPQTHKRKVLITV
jgi:hypothetical protein